METVTLEALKTKLCFWISLVNKGRTIQITRYNRPYALLSPPYSPHLHQGDKVGKFKLEPVISGGTAGRVLALLSEDREDKR